MQNVTHPRELTIEQAISQAKKASKRGNIALAVELYNTVLQHQPNHPIAKKGVRKLRKDLALSQSRQAQTANPSQDQMNALVDLYHSGQLVKTEQACRELLQVYPQAVFILNVLGVAFQEQGKFHEAVQAFNRAIELKPDYADAYSNRGNALCDLGQLQEAVASYEKAIQLLPDYADAYSNRGNALYKLGRLQEALQSCEMAIRLKPDYAEAYCNRGNALRELWQLEEAVGSYEKAIEHKPGYAEAYCNRGNALSDLGRLQEAVVSYQKAIELRPDLGIAHANLCDLYEKHNRLADLETAVHHARQVLAENHPELLFILALLASREKRFEAARDFLERITPETLLPRTRLRHSELLSKTYDRLGEYSSAFAQFEITNTTARQLSAGQQFSARRYLDRVLKTSASWASAGKVQWSKGQAATKQNPLAFLVGFPRSGTTLLDTILRSHPEVLVVEEKHMVESMRTHLGGLATVDHLTDLDDKQIAGLREVYFEELHAHVNPDGSHQLIIDKLPLNIIDAGLIHRVFPDSKFILALRHPYDCVLSCFMQNFQLNDAMANFLTLQQAARLYDAVMSLWVHYNDALDLEAGVLRYEDVVLDLQDAVEPLLNFLGLAWHDHVLNFQQTALSRKAITTPSYNQVTQRLYTQAIGRWKNYQDHINGIAPLLEPWAKSFGYSTEP
ncbi:MAG: tetratricopeptide repeat protein [Gammaproteobacteria bacterium]|jgi:tetratricopeptide (TPR) repeat protein|nr:tetratricopeptide repeat protein [Gammaproteobacteria bacterium]